MTHPVEGQDQGALQAQAPSVTTEQAEGAVVGLEQWGWRVRTKADEKRNAGPWSWQEKPLDATTEQWAEQEPVYVPAIAKGGAS